MKRETWFLGLVAVVVIGAGIGWTISSVTTPNSSLGPKVEHELQELQQRGSGFLDDDEAPMVNTKPQTSDWQVNGDTYQTSISYDTPAGTETNQISLTFADGTVTKYDFTLGSNGSKQYQQRFADQLDQMLVGKSVSELADLDAVAGATLTSNAFKAAISSLPQ